jgi:hypothetical protein
MLVYCSRMTLHPMDGLDGVLHHVARWLSQKSEAFVDVAKLKYGLREVTSRKGVRVYSQCNQRDDADAIVWPYLFCAQLSHVDRDVSGRLWQTQIGVRQFEPGGDIECTVLLKTEDLSTRVVKPIQVSRPWLVEELAKHCEPTLATPGVRIKTLDEAGAEAFLALVEHKERTAPLVLVSCRPDGSRLVDLERLRSLLVGLADVVEVPAGVNTFAIEAVVGRRYNVFGGAINMIGPPRRGLDGWQCETWMLLPAQAARLIDAGASIEIEVLAAVTHRTNLRNSWRHISTDVVAQAKIHSHLLQAIVDSRRDDSTTLYTDLLVAADQELSEKDKEISNLREQLEVATDELQQQREESSRLMRNGRSIGSVSVDDELRNAVVSTLGGQYTLETSLRLVELLYSDRIIVLPSAHKSARNSQDFRYGKIALDLLLKLATGYWSVLADGKTDGEAKAAFGRQDYSPVESFHLTPKGRARRTFRYQGQDLFMERHLRHGVKDSSAETLRIHFEWIASERRIVIGHCGKHLDF